MHNDLGCALAAPAARLQGVPGIGHRNEPVQQLTLLFLSALYQQQPSSVHHPPETRCRLVTELQLKLTKYESCACHILI